MESFQKTCPHCGKTIKAKADICRYCQQDVSAVPGGADAPASAAAIAAAATPGDLRGKWYCSHCGVIGRPKRYTKGSFGIEIVLYLLMILPGVLYTVWRLTSKYEGCPSCGSPNMMPATSPKAQAAINAAAQ